MSKFFIGRPIVAIVIAIIMVLVGAVALVSLPTAQFPSIAPPDIQILATFTGADAKTLEASVATPIEQQVTGVDHMNYMTSTNSNSGQMRLIVDFDVATDPNIDQVLTELRESQAAAQLPPQVIAAGVTVQKSPLAPMMLVALASPKGTYDKTFLANYAYINLVDQLTRSPGVSNINVFGAGQYAMRVWVDPLKLAKLNITVPQIIQAINVQNTVNPTGQIGGEPVPNGQQLTYTVRTQGRLVSAEQFGQIILRSNPDGSTLRLKEVARIELGAQTYAQEGQFNGKPAAVMAIYQLPGTNAVETAAGVRKIMQRLSASFPPDMTYGIALDTTRAVTAGIHDIFQTLLIALILVVVVVYVFLQGWRATLIPVAAIPVSLIGTFAVFPLLGFSINTLTLFGLVLAIGLVVDDAIVVVEATERHIEDGMNPRDAAIKAMEQVSGPVIATALILTAVFVPTVFIAGITGRLYQQFAVTIALSVVFSAFNALSLSPALCALLLRPKQPPSGWLSRFFAAFDRVFGKLTDRYVGISGRLIRKSALSLVFLGLVALVAVLIARHLPTSFLPNEDQGYFYAGLQLPEAASLQRTAAAAEQIDDIIMKTPGVETVVAVVGFNLLTTTQTTYNAFFFVQLKNWDQRRHAGQSAQAIEDSVTRRLRAIKEGTGFAFSPPAIPGVGTSGGVTMMLEDRTGGPPQFLTDNLAKFQAAARARPEIASINSSYVPNVPQLFVDVDRAQVSRLGVSLADVYETMQTFMGGYLVNYFNEFGRQWQVYVEAEGHSRTNPKNIGQFYVSGTGGAPVPLSAVSAIKTITGPEYTLRYNEYESAQLNVAAKAGYSSGQAMKALEEVFASTMPTGMGMDYQGMSFQEEKAAQGVSTGMVFGLSIVFVFLILAAQYESWSLPFSVLLSTPVALFGAYLALWSRHFENNVYAQIGVVMLIGLAAKNAILIVEFAKTEYEGGKPIEDAALTAARIRFRPIMMTAFAFIFGCLPLWLASGSGAAGRQDLGTAVIGGMLAASLVAIFLIPVTFAVVERVTHRGPKEAR